jgi:predicted TIM-barrel fold metal-dependent hydrolase
VTADSSAAAPGAGLVDAQVHVWEHDHPCRPWDPARRANRARLLGAGRAAEEEEPVPWPTMLSVMDGLGIRAALLVATSHYGWDNSYSLEAAARHPARFAVVGRLDPAAPDVTDRVEAWRAQPGAAGLRLLIMNAGQRDQARAGRFDLLLRAAQRCGLPMSIFPPGHLPEIAAIAMAHPELQVIVDHLGMAQPPLMEPDDPPLRQLPHLLALARHPNVAVKLTAVPVLSREPFPYKDLGPAVRQLIDAFGPERLMWGTDWQRVRPVLSAEESVRWFTDVLELSAGERALIGGGTVRRLFPWPALESPIS